MDLTEQLKGINTARKYPHKELTDKIIQVFYCVYNELGYGFLENVYQNALYLELQQKGFHTEAQQPIDVYYKNTIVGKYKADLIVNDTVIVELKATDGLMLEHEYQLINYLRATNKEVGLLLNFGIKPDIRRKIFTNDRKKVCPNRSGILKKEEIRMTNEAITQKFTNLKTVNAQTTPLLADTATTICENPFDDCHLCAKRTQRHQAYIVSGSIICENPFNLCHLCAKKKENPYDNCHSYAKTRERDVRH